MAKVEYQETYAINVCWTHSILARCPLRAGSSLERGDCIPDPGVAGRFRAAHQHLGDGQIGAKRAFEGAAGPTR